MVTVEFDSMGEAVRLALVADEYVGGGPAVLLLDATDPRSEGYMAEWGVLTASVPAAAEWCRGRGNIAIDADVPAALLEALEAAGTVRMAGRSAASGMARYPLATVAGHALAGMGGLSETSRRRSARRSSSSTSRAATAARSRWGPRRPDRPSSSDSSPPRGPRPTRWRAPADGLPSGLGSGMPRPSTARRAGRSTWPGRNDLGPYPCGHAGAGTARRFPGMSRAIPGPLRPKGPKAPWNPLTLPVCQEQSPHAVNPKPMNRKNRDSDSRRDGRNRGASSRGRQMFWSVLGLGFHYPQVDWLDLE